MAISLQQTAVYQAARKGRKFFSSVRCSSGVYDMMVMIFAHAMFPSYTAHPGL